MNYKHFLLALSLLISQLVFAQSEPIVFDKTIVSIVPQYLITQGIRLDIEKQIKGSHFIQVCPQFYSSQDTKYGNGYEYSTGAGLFLYHKYFPNSDFINNEIYISYGLTYNFYNLKPAENATSGIEDRNINKIGADLIIGVQFFYNDVISFDLFTGLGTRVSFINGEMKPQESDRGYSAYDYSGNLLLLGFRLGVLF